MKAPSRAIKTINLNSDIFYQQNPLRSTLPINLLRSFVQRKRNSNNGRTVVQRYSLKPSRNYSLNHEQPQQRQQRPSILQPNKDYKITDRKSLKLKTHLKTNTEINIRRRHNSIDIKEHILNVGQHQHEQAEESDDKMGNCLALKQEFLEKGRNQTFYRENNQNNKVNPYTHQEYTYIRHREQDYMTELKKSTRIKRMSSIMKSYQVAPIALAPATHKRRPSVIGASKLKTTYFRTHSKQKVDKASPLNAEADASSPSPWDWGYQHQISRDFTF